MKKTIIAAVITLVTATAAYSVSASPFGAITNDPDVLVHNPIPQEVEEMACYGCISPRTGRPRTNYVRPHYRGNGTYVRGYWRS